MARFTKKLKKTAARSDTVEKNIGNLTRKFSLFKTLKFNVLLIKNIRVLNDGTDSNENRLGGIGDLWLAIKKEEINEDLLVVLGDNLFDFDLQPPIYYDLKDLNK